jgi:hypothetical protein
MQVSFIDGRNRFCLVQALQKQKVDLNQDVNIQLSRIWTLTIQRANDLQEENRIKIKTIINYKQPLW